MTTPTAEGPPFDLPIGSTKTLTIQYYDADAATATIIEATDVNRFKVWLTDDANPDIDADSITPLTDTATVVFATGVFTSASDHGLVVGDPISFTNSGGALPAGLVAEKPYWLITQPADDTFTLSATKGGSAITLTDNGTGTHTWVERRSTISVTTVGSVGVPAEVVVTLDQADTLQLTADTDYNYEAALVDDDDNNRYKTIVRGICRTIGSSTGDRGVT